jgi:hypothetical protein
LESCDDDDEEDDNTYDDVKLHTDAQGAVSMIIIDTVQSIA